MTHPTKICCLMPNYNNEKYIEQAIDSVLSQSVTCDILIVDDGSTDNSLSIIKEKAKVNKNIQYIAKSNGGPASARNAGLESIASKDYDFVLLLDSDDFIYEKFVEKCLEAIDYDDLIIGAYSDYNILVNVPEVEPFLCREYKRSVTQELLWRECVMPHLALIKVDAFKCVKQRYGYFYDESLRVCNDYDMDLKLCQFGIISHIPECLSVVREGVNNSCSPIQGEIREKCHMRLKTNNMDYYL